MEALAAGADPSDHSATIAALALSLELSAEQTKALTEQSTSWVTGEEAPGAARGRPEALPQAIIANAESIEGALNADQKIRFGQILSAYEAGSITRARVWLMKTDDSLDMVGVSLGISDGNASELILGPLDPEAQIVIGARGGASESTSSNRPRRGPGFF